MSALDSVPPERLAELLASAAPHLAAPVGRDSALTPAGILVREGRLHLGRLCVWLDVYDRVAVVAGFASAVWIGARHVAPPRFGRLAYRTETAVDRRGRLLLDFRVRSRLGVADALAFEVVIVAAEPCGGLLIVRFEDSSRR